MKTVGQIIKSERLKRNFTVDHLSALTKIDTKYIKALEEDKYSDLPSETFAKGFIRNISLRLDLNPSELVAIFRRDYRQPEPQVKIKSKHKSKIPHISTQFLPFIFGGLVFVIYLIFQFRAILTPPKLEIQEPQKNAVLVSPINIEGDTSIDSEITINDDTEVNPDSTGHFSARLNLPVGEVVLQIKSINRFGRVAEEKIPVTIISK